MIIQTKQQLHQLVLTQWLTEQLFSPIWFGTVAFVIFSYVLFFSLVDKKRIIEILLFGSLVAAAYTVYDLFGSQFVYWTYTKRMIPFTPSPFIDVLTISPLYSMLAYQYSNTWKSFLLWNAVWAGGIAFGYYSVLINLGVFTFHIPGGMILHFAYHLILGIIARGIMVALFGIEAQVGKESARHSLSKLIAQPAMKPEITETRPNKED